MSISVVQAAAIPNAFSGSFGANVAAGNSILMVPTAFAAPGGVITTQNPTYGGSPVAGAAKLAEVNLVDASVSSMYVAAWLLPAVAGGSAAVSVGNTGATVNANTGLLLYEVAGLGPTPALDASSTGKAVSGTAISSGAAGPIGQAPEFVLGAYMNDNGTTGAPGSPWTSQSISAPSAAAAGYQIPAVAGGSYTFAATESASGPWAALAVTLFAPAIAVAAAPPGGGMSMLKRGLLLADL